MSTPNPEQISIPASLTIYDITPQAELWRSQLAVSRPSALSLADLSELDAAGFQALLSLIKALQRLEFDGPIIAPDSESLAAWLMPKLRALMVGDHHA